MSPTKSISAYIKKYAIIIIIFSILEPLISTELAGWFVNQQSQLSAVEYSSWWSISFSAFRILLNLSVAILMLSDTRAMKLRWLFFCLIAVRPLIGIVFVLFMKLSDQWSFDSKNATDQLK